jgi:prepilin-type N-terminal cleavage/methylation domain-containing protein
MQKNKNILAGFTLIELLLVIVILGILIVIALNVINPGRIQRRSYEAVLLSNGSKMCAAMFACAVAASAPTTECDSLPEIGVNTPPNIGGLVPQNTVGLSPFSTTMLRVTTILPGAATSKNVSAAETGTANTYDCAVSCTYDTTTGASTPAAKNPSILSAAATTRVYSGCY